MELGYLGDVSGCEGCGRFRHATGVGVEFSEPGTKQFSFMEKHKPLGMIPNF